MTYFLIGFVLGVICGVVLGGFVVKQFNVIDNEYSIDKIRAKKGAKIDINQKNNDDGNTKRALGRVGSRINGIFKGRSKSNAKRKGQ